MNGLVPAISGGLVRTLMAFAAGHGVELGNDQAETVVQAVLAVVPVVWTIVQKIRQQGKVQKAAATGVVP